jgi:Holliday junction DNA helicase RuvA
MIARLDGILLQKSVAQCVVDIHGIGYRVVVPLSTFYELPDAGCRVVLQIHTHVREDAVSLYGFHTDEEREVFKLMISVGGIGPKLAVNILSGITAGDWIRAIVSEDLKRLTGIPGVGRKTAERMILELKDKAGHLGHEVPPAGDVVLRTAEQTKEDALSALVNLGYKGSSVRDAVELAMKAASEPISLDDLLKKALRFLAG